MKFRGHETFSIRKGWLNKGMREVAADPTVFSAKQHNPMDVFGIGSNMVKSLRYWLSAVGLVQASKGKSSSLSLTEFGELVHVFDPYVEETGTLWLLHYHLVKKPDLATSWYFFFNEFQLSEFDKEDFAAALANYARMNGGIDPPLRSLEDDFNCIVNTYIPRYKISPTKEDPESNMECPLSELGLLELQNRKSRLYRKIVPAAHTIPSAIAAAVLLDQAAGRREVPLTEIQTKPGGLGKAFNLDTITLLTVLNEVERAGFVKVIRTAGLDVLQITTDLTFLGCVERYYQTLSQRF